MYRSCIFCSGKLGSNDAIEGFPVGRTVAFDAGKGRLWAVCPTCGRWNLAPLEERWEVVEEAERTFRDARVRVHAENIGLTKLRDGTRLVRVGQALPRELAAWRFGDEIRRRWKRHRTIERIYGALWIAPTGMIPSVGFMLGGPGGLLASLAVSGVLSQALAAATRRLDRIVREPVERVVRHANGVPLLARDLVGAYLTGEDRTVVLNVPRGDGWVEFRGPEARAVLSRGIVSFNAAGAEQVDVDAALGLLAQFPSADDFLLSLARRRSTLWRGSLHDQADVPVDHRYWIRRAERLGVPRQDFFRWQLTRDEPCISDDFGWGRQTLLAIEMGLQEEQERRALEGELAELEAAWRYAEEIAGIADRLPDLPPSEPPHL